MLQREIVIKGFGTQIDIDDPLCMKYASTSFHSIVWVFISINVTIYRDCITTEVCNQSLHNNN